MSKTIAMMQPYLFPYLGYFQLIAASDLFVLGDDLQYVKGSWVNRNRILVNGEPKFITFPLKKDCHTLNINQRYLSGDIQGELSRIIRMITLSYSRAPFFSEVLPWLEQVMRFPQINLARYAENAIRETCAYLHITTPILRSSDLHLPPPVDHQDRVIQTMEVLGGNSYINPIGGLGLYSPDYFMSRGIKLNFHRIDEIEYKQLTKPFVANLSIIDLLMFNGVDQIQNMLKRFSLGVAEEDFRSLELNRPYSQGCAM
ncbi:WbqC family protein [Metapseudomonas boanensis]|uniref:WbqC family protein n=1 Tax=Metapseudomonas boanensis TaxID=2822138 RepID=A0ABS5XDN0_9GAMM|nr:WbqC family protein [Pseudomonas boanensis]MBT8765796.1 WbqC family protein [Pseudomonas boanensis]